MALARVKERDPVRGHALPTLINGLILTGIKMNKSKEKNYTLSDFMTKDKNETATKMPLMYDGNDTGCYLMVKGIESKSIQRARITAQVGYADAAEKSEAIKDKIDKAEFERTEKESIEIELAVKLIDGWSFNECNEDGKRELLEQNQGLAFAVIAHATTPSNYLEKK